MGAYLACALAGRGDAGPAELVLLYGGQPPPAGDVRTRHVDLHVAPGDPWFDDEELAAVEAGFRNAGSEVTVHRYEGAGHWFAEEGSPGYEPDRRRAGAGPGPRPPPRRRPADPAVATRRRGVGQALAERGQRPHGVGGRAERQDRHVADVEPRLPVHAQVGVHDRRPEVRVVPSGPGRHPERADGVVDRAGPEALPVLPQVAPVGPHRSGPRPGRWPAPGRRRRAAAAQVSSTVLVHPAIRRKRSVTSSFARRRFPNSTRGRYRSSNTMSLPSSRQFPKLNLNSTSDLVPSRRRARSRPGRSRGRASRSG